MSGPTPSQYGFGAPHPGRPGPYAHPGDQQAGRPQGLGPDSSYPGALPPPVDYPRRRRWPWVVGVLGAVVVAAAAVTGGYLAGRSGGEDNITNEQARAAIQNYVDALASGDTEQVSRHTLCGLYDAVKDHALDEQIAKLNSDTFREGFEKVDVVSVDKMVFAAPSAAQALFTVRTTPAQQGQQEREVQGVAQILRDNENILVCSYLLRTSGY